MLQLELWELIKEFAKWAGWFPITIIVGAVAVLNKYYSDKDASAKEQEIRKIRNEAENYKVDVLVQHLSKKVEEYEKILKGLDSNKEKDQKQVMLIQQEKEIIERELENARSEIATLKSDLGRGISRETMDPNKLADLLKDEYIMLQTMYEEMDSKGLTIKNWAITVSVAIIGTSLLNDKKDLLWVAFAASFVFWYLEAYWRGLSHFFSVRIQEIETAIQNGTWNKGHPLQFYSSWTREYQRRGDQTWRYMWKTASLLPHAILPFLILALYFLW